MGARAACSEALVKIGGEEAANSAAALLSNEDAGVRAYAARALGGLGKDGAMHAESLSAFRGDADKEVRIAVREALMKLGVNATGTLPEVIGNGDALPPNVVANL